MHRWSYLEVIVIQRNSAKLPCENSSSSLPPPPRSFCLSVNSKHRVVILCQLSCHHLACQFLLSALSHEQADHRPGGTRGSESVQIQSICKRYSCSRYPPQLTAGRNCFVIRNFHAPCSPPPFSPSAAAVAAETGQVEGFCLHQ